MKEIKKSASFKSKQQGKEQKFNIDLNYSPEYDSFIIKIKEGEGFMAYSWNIERMPLQVIQKLNEMLEEVLIKAGSKTEMKEHKMYVGGKVDTKLSIDEVEKIAKETANALGTEFRVTKDSVDTGSFDLDYMGEEYEGGSYIIMENGDIVNVALPKSEVYYNYKTKKKANLDFKGGYNYEFGGDFQAGVYKSGGSIKESDIKVGEKFKLMNGEVIEIKRLFQEKHSADNNWVEFTRNGKSQESSVRSLKIFINNWREGKKFAMGGSLQAHGIKQGDTFIKTISGNIQKVKDRNGKIVYVDLSTGERDAQPTLPFDDGGGVWKKQQREAVNKLDADFEKAVKEKGISITSKEASDFWRSGGFQNRMKKIFKKDYDEGGMVSEDLFENYNKQPKQLAKIVDFYMNKYEEGEMSYQDTKKFLKEVEAVGYTFDYGLDNEPYGLRPIGTKLKEYDEGGEVTYFLNKDGIKVRSKVEPKRKLTEAEWMAKHNSSREARTYAFGGLFSKSPMMSRPKPIDLNQEQVRLKSGEYVQVLNQQGDTLMVIDLSKLGTSTTPKYVKLSDVDMTSFANGGGVGLIGNQKRIDMNKNGKIDAEDFEIMRNTMDGAWRKDRKYVNSTTKKDGKLVDYEVRYARKNNSSRTGYKGKRKFANGGGLKQSLVSGTSGRWIAELPHAKYKITKEVTNAQSSGKYNSTYTNIVLPKGSIVHNLRGGVFVESEKLKEKYPTIYNSKYGLPIIRKEETLNEIYKNSEILEYAGGGGITNLDFKNFTLDELINNLPEDVDFMWINKANTKDYVRRYSSEFRKYSNKKFTITDSGKMELSKGSENMYLDIMVFESSNDAPETEYVISIYTKDNHKGLKEFTNNLVQKFAGGGGVGEKYVYKTNNRIFADDLVKYADLQYIKASSKKVGSYYYVTTNKKIEARESMPKELAKIVGGKIFKEGGGISNFERLSRVVAKNYEGKRVKPQYQKEYGKVYSKAEAKEVGNKVAEKMKMMKKAESGAEVKKTNRGGVMLLAKKIRKKGESWKDALKRAGQQLK